GGSLRPWNNKTAGDLTRVWMLRIGDYQNQSPTPLQVLTNWSMNFTFGLSPRALGAPVPGLVMPVSFLTPYPSKVNALPEVGIGPSPSVAADNTLGSFDPFQGRIYLTYVDRFGGADDY